MGRKKLDADNIAIAVTVYKPTKEINKRGGLDKVREKISKYFDKMK